MNTATLIKMLLSIDFENGELAVAIIDEHKNSGWFKKTMIELCWHVHDNKRLDPRYRTTQVYVPLYKAIKIIETWDKQNRITRRKKNLTFIYGGIVKYLAQKK